MTVETAREVSTNPEVLKRLAKYLAQQCFRSISVANARSTDDVCGALRVNLVCNRSSQRSLRRLEGWEIRGGAAGL